MATAEPPASPASWKELLADRIDPDLGREIDIFETQLELRKQGKIEERLFAETRLRRGAYGQRYDNGQRHDGLVSQSLAFPDVPTKGPHTMWDAPGMQRIKIPLGRLTAAQLETLAEVAEDYSDGILHVTTRQDFQLHFVHIDDTPDLMRRLAAAGITTREACGNTVRNVTACPYVGVCTDESFDVTPYAHALTYFLLGHPDTQDFGRKFKVAFSGCADHACGLVHMHDLGYVARSRTGRDGTLERGFAVYLGGGLGSLPHQAKLVDDFMAEGEALPFAQALARVFARLGEKKNRGRARLKFLVEKLGFDELVRLVREERAKLPADARWTTFLDDLAKHEERPLKPGSTLGIGTFPAGFAAWSATNVRPQRQLGYSVVTITLPLGDLTAAQARALADIARRHCGDTIRTTVDQNIVLRWVPDAEAPAVYEALRDAGLASPGANTITDVTACPGTDTCKLGISSSRGLSSVLSEHLAKRELDPSVRRLQVKASGCFNACGQHHIADIGLLGVARKVGNHRVPHFQIVLGGETTRNAGAYGLAIGAVPSKRIPEAVDRITDLYARSKRPDETFQAFVQRIGKLKVKQLLEDLTVVGSHELESDLYSDWGDPREYTTGDMGVGECAGEVVPFVQFGLAASEREVFEAQMLLDAGQPSAAARRAFGAMLTAAQSLARTQNQDVSDEADVIVAEFRKHFHDTGLFHDPFAGDKFAQSLFRAHEASYDDVAPDVAHRQIEEASLFIDAAHACYTKMDTA
ncbi:MAG: nitrite/sulfite reductase [Deltaproteobacteria bacterium]|nr:nitrite/sulfite reductase [Deltaproteobacteria bacterium]